MLARPAILKKRGFAGLSCSSDMRDVRSAAAAEGTACAIVRTGLDMRLAVDAVGIEQDGQFALLHVGIGQINGGFTRKNECGLHKIAPQFHIFSYYTGFF